MAGAEGIYEGMASDETRTGRLHQIKVMGFRGLWKALKEEGLQ